MTIKKVAIITMHCPLNYGAVLQTYALQTYIESLGHSVEIIDYKPDFIVKNQSLTYVPDEYASNLVKKIAYIVFKLRKKYLRKSTFVTFAKHYLRLTSHTYQDDLDNAQAELNADKYICGSDQIWGYTNNAYKDSAYFLGFVDDSKKCIAYAPSGKVPDPIPSDYIQKAIPYIQRLNNISVREKKLKERLQPYIYQEIHHVADPVFLLEANVWTQLSKDSGIKSPYLLLYIVGSPDLALSVANNMSKKLGGVPIVLISASSRKLKGVTRKILASPNQFIDLFQKASFVVTNSFHGTAFSIIYRRPFYVCQTNIGNERIESILEICNIKNALVTDANNLKEWSYDSFNQEDLDNYIKYSKDYLISSIGK